MNSVKEYYAVCIRCGKLLSKEECHFVIWKADTCHSYEVQECKGCMKRAKRIQTYRKIKKFIRSLWL